MNPISPAVLMGTSLCIGLLANIVQAQSVPIRLAAAPAPPTVWSPPSDAPTGGAAGSIDSAKMPQINGIHIGTPIADAKAALQKLYPGRQVDALNGQTMGAQHQSWPQALRAMGDSIGTDETDVDVTYAPGPQLVWHVNRIAHQPNVAHDVLVAALRAKYGKETVALHNG